MRFACLITTLDQVAIPAKSTPPLPKNSTHGPRTGQPQWEVSSSADTPRLLNARVLIPFLQLMKEQKGIPSDCPHPVGAVRDKNVQIISIRL